MTAFLIAASLLSLVALSVLLVPLWRDGEADDLAASHQRVNLAVLRDHLRELALDLKNGVIGADAYQAACDDLAQRVADDALVDAAPAPLARSYRARVGASLVALGVLGGAAGLYARLGTPAGLEVAAPDAAALTLQQAEAMVARLERHMETDRANAEGWLLLARSQTALKRYGAAGQSYARLLALAPGDAATLADYAEVLASAQGSSFQGAPEQILRRALRIDPNHPKGLFLLGSAQFERGDAAAAIQTWNVLSGLLPESDDLYKATASNLEEARASLSGATDSAR